MRLCFGLCLVLLVLLAGLPGAGAQSTAGPSLPAPIAMYGHVFEQGGVSSSRPSTEKLALADLNQLDRLKKAGVRFDFDLLDAASFAPAGGHIPDWPDGPDAWIARCRAVGVRPGLRFASKDGSPSDLLARMQSWYDHGVRLFELDSIDLTAAAPASADKLTGDETAAGNSKALREVITAFRDKNRDAELLIIAGTPNLAPPMQPDHSPASSNFAGRFGIAPIFLTGEPESSTLPQANFRRSIEIATDDRVRRIEQSGVPLRQIDSAGFSTAAHDGSGSGVHAVLPTWKGEFLLAMARGGWVNTVSGNLESIQDSDARWMARVQKLFFTLQEEGQIHSFGGAPGAGQPYGFAGATSHGSIDVVVNPGQSAATLDLPASSPTNSNVQPSRGSGRVLFRDAGFLPKLSGDTIQLGPGQMAVVGFGAYSAPAFSLGVQEDVVIPSSIEPIQAAFQSTAPGTIEARINPPIEGVLRVIVQAEMPGGEGSGNLSTDIAGQNAANPFVLEATQSGRPIPLRMGDGDSSSFVSDGASWAVAEIDVDDLTPGIPVRVSFQSNEKVPPTLEGRAYQVVY